MHRQSWIAVTQARTAGWIAIGLLVAVPVRVVAQCVGDCNSDGLVTINELITGVNIALETSPLSNCPAFDINGNGRVSVHEVVIATRNALDGCNGLQPGPGPQGVAIGIGSARGGTAQTVTVPVTLSVGTGIVVATDNVIAFEPGAPIVSCAADPAINKSATTFSFRPVGCSPGIDCESVRVIVLSFSNVNPIPDGSVLYTCDVAISPGADPRRSFPLTCLEPAASGPAGEVADVSCGNAVIGMPPGITLSTATGTPGDQVTFAATLLAGEASVATAQSDVTFDVLNVPVARKGDGSPDCAVNPAINKDDAVFTFPSPNRLRAVIFSYANSDPISGGSTLYTCTVNIADEAIGGEYPLDISGVLLIDPAGAAVPGALGLNGSIVVSGGAPTPTPVVPGMPAIVLSTATGAPGDTVSVEAILNTAGNQIAGTDNVITFNVNTAIVGCMVNPAIGKEATAFQFRPSGCVPGLTCTEVRALVLSLSNVDPIPNGATLYSCEVEISARAASGEYPLTIGAVRAQTADGFEVNATGVSGRVIVGEPQGTRTPGTLTPAQTATRTRTPAPTASPTRASTPTRTATQTPAATPTTAPCPGDCNGDSKVDIAELITGVGIALGNQELTRCPAFDASGNGGIEINELVKAVNSALCECRPCPTPPPTPTPCGDPVGCALDDLAAGNLRAANGTLSQALQTNPNDDRANLYYAMTRIAVKLIEDRRIKDLLARGGVVVHGGSANVCDLDLDSPAEVPLGAPRSGEIIDTVREVIVPELTGALENIRRISPNVNVRFALRHLPDCVDPPTDVDVVDIDRADVLALEAGIEGLSAFADLLASYNLDASLKTAIDESAQTLFAAEPGLLTLRSAAMLASAREHFEAAFGSASEAMDVMQAETDDQSDDILVILPEDAEDAAKGQRVLDLVRESLRHEVVIPIDIVTGEIVLMDIGLLSQERLNLSRFFSGQFRSLRPFLPAFDEDGEFDSHRFPDPTFGGSTPDLTQDDIDNFLAEADYFD